MKIKLNKKFYKEDCDYPDIQQFRIYDPNEEVFYYSGGTPTMLADFFEFTASLHTYYGMPYQKMTGLEDKNKKEIYEGDIIIKKYISKTMGEDKEVVEWNIDGYDIFCNYGEDSSFDIKSLEIIGNIYENKKLIK